MNNEFKKEFLKYLPYMDEENGIDTRKLEPTTKIIVETKNSTYEMEILDDKGNVLVLGGKFFTEPAKAYFNGSTWGGSMIKVGWVGYKMNMEIISRGSQILTTTAAQTARIIAPEWEYAMEWATD